MSKTAKEQVREYQGKDLKVSELAKIIGVTTQRIYQILDELRAEETEAQEISA